MTARELLVLALAAIGFAPLAVLALACALAWSIRRVVWAARGR